MTDDIEVRQRLTKVGNVLIIVGLIDVGVMIYCISKNESYASSFNVLAIVAGIFLRKGSLKTAVRVARFAGFLCGALLILPISFRLPIDLLFVSLRLHPTAIFEVLWIAVLISCAAWSATQLSSSDILAVAEAKGVGTTSYKHPALGIILGLAVGIILPLSLKATVADALAKAKEKMPGNYKYAVISIQQTNGAYAATVAAYNTNELKWIAVDSRAK